MAHLSYSSAENSTPDIEWDTVDDSFVPQGYAETVMSCDLSFDGVTCKFSIRHYDAYSDVYQWGIVDIVCELMPNTVPIELVTIGVGEDGDSQEADSWSFAKVITTLGLRETSSAQLLVFLISRALSADDLLNEIFEQHFFDPCVWQVHYFQGHLLSGKLVNCCQSPRSRGAEEKGAKWSLLFLADMLQFSWSIGL